MTHHYPPIGVMRTCFTEKFGVPRQSLMITEAKGVLKLNPDPEFRAALNHLQSFSHIWVVFVFNQHIEKGWRATIRPPRLNGPRRVGVFASRSPHRPNPIGMSALKLEHIDLDAPGGIELHLSGVDILDNTPVLDIKPYLPYTDKIDDASSGWADGEIKRYPVTFSPEALQSIQTRGSQRHPHLQELITQMLEWDPRPRSQRAAIPIEDPLHEGKSFGFGIFDFDVQWQIRAQGIYVLDLVLPRPR